MKKRNIFVTLLAVVFSFGLILPSMLLVASEDVSSGIIGEDGEYYTITYTNPDDRLRLAEYPRVQTIKNENWGAVVRTSPELARSLADDYVINVIPDRTTVNLVEQGIEFDSSIGYEIPQEWSVDSSDLYLIQFVAPVDREWRAEIEDQSTAFFGMIGDNLAVVKLSAAQRSTVSALPYVEWTDIYQPYYKVYENAREQTGKFRIKVSPIGVTIEELARQLRFAGATETLLNDAGNMVEAMITESLLPSIAKLECVSLIQHLPNYVQQGGLSSEMVGAYVAWDTTRSNLPQMVAGEGQVYQHNDLGFDQTHWDFTQGPLGNRILFKEGTTNDGNSHSTGCVGIAAGNGYDMEGWLGLDNMNRDYAEFAATNPIGFIDRAGFAGRAPESSIVFYQGLVTSDWDNGYTTYGARIFSNSFGPATVTNGYVNDADAFMASYPEGLVFFSGCNYGPADTTITGVGNGKMVVSVGAAENNRGDWFDTSDNPYGLWTGSCKGPVSASDMRVKPDVVEYGAGMLMPKSDDHGAADDDVYRGSNNDATWGIQYDGDARFDYYKNQGTSFSCPAAAGDAILIRDYLQDIVGMPAPDPMAIKAYLIHGAQDMGFGLPSYGQGWGMCNVEYSICPPAPYTNQYYTGVAGTGAPISIDVNSSAVPLKVTMTHWDSDTSSGTLTTDYDIVVTSPSGTRYEGNAFAESRSIPINAPADWSGCAFPSWAARPSSYPTGAYDWDTSDDGGDDINNVEVVIIDTPEKGTWTIDVLEKSGGGPSWHVVAAADFGPVVNYDVEVSQDVPVTWHMRNGYGTGSFQAPAGQTVAVGFKVHNFGLMDDTITLSATYQGDGSTAGSPLPAGWSVSYDTGASLSLMANEVRHIVARVTSSAAATEGAYPIRIMAQSTGSAQAQDFYVFNIDIVNRRMPNRVRVTHDAYSLPDMTPGVAAYNDGGTEYVVVAYCRDIGIGNRVFVSVSNDGGATFGPQIQVTNEADDPNYLMLKCAPPGHDYEGRMFAAYNGMNPLQNGDDWDDVSERRAVICYADPPYNSWTTNIAWTGTTGSAANCDYRELDVGFWIDPGGPDEVHFMTLEYKFGSNSMGSAINDMTPCEKISTDGGATWGAATDINAGGTNWQFNLGCNNDADGDLCMSFYMISGTRVQFYRNYDGAWSGEVQAMNLNPYGAQWGYSGGDPTVDRYYVVAGRAAQSNYNDWKLPMVTYTDNDGGSWSTPAGPLGGSNNICDNGHFDGTNLMDVDVTDDSYAWVTAKQGAPNPTNGYWVYNLYTASSNDGFASWNDYYPTRDSFSKEPAFHTVRQGNNLLLAYNSIETGHSDIFLLKMYNGWDTDLTDNLGPITKFVHVPDEWPKDVPLSILANVDDISTGYSDIQAAEYRWDGGTASLMNADDGFFDNVMESVNGLSTVSLSQGPHYVEVRAQDDNGNWGEWTGKWVNIYDVTLPDAPVFAGLNKVINLGTGTSLRLAWNAALDYHNEYPITYYIYRETFSGFDPNVTAVFDTWTPGGVSPGDPLTYDDNTVTAGTEYFYIVRAEDTGGTLPDLNPLKEYNFEERSGIPETLVWFQVQSPAAGYRNLNMDPFEPLIQTSTSGSLDAPGQYQIDLTPENKWLSDVVTADLNGDWRFYIYGTMSNTNANGTLFASVYRYSDSALLFTTGLDDENIADFTSGYHQFIWDYTASGLPSLIGDQYYIELWLDVTDASSAPGGTIVYDYTTGVQTDKWAYEVDSDSSPPEAIPNGEYELGAPGEYDLIATSDDGYEQSRDPGNNDYVSLKCVMWLGEIPADIQSIELHWEGYVTQAYAGPEIILYAYNTATTSWVEVGQADFPEGLPDTTVTHTLSGINWADYVVGANNEFIWLVHYAHYDRLDQGNPVTTRMYTDYVKATVQKIDIPGGEFTFAYDHDLTPSAVHVPAGAPPMPQPYDIDLAGFLAGDWVFVSFPIEITGDVPTIFDDSAFGDGGTTWDCVQWFDNVNKVWTDYNVYKPPALRDTSAIDNTGGFWIHLTANGGDEMLTTGLEDFFPSGATGIDLFAGWNLVGYPSATARLASDALAGTSADMIAYHNPVAPYRIDETSDLGSVMMEHGNAYWVRVPADTTWNLGP
jgi:hypothetical protein